MIADRYISSARNMSVAILSLGVISLLFGLDLRELQHLSAATEDMWVLFRTQELLTKIQQGVETVAVPMDQENSSQHYGISSSLGNYIVNVSPAIFRNSEPAYFVQIYDPSTTLPYFVIVAPHERRTGLAMWSSTVQPSFSPYLLPENFGPGLGSGLEPIGKWGRAAIETWQSIDPSQLAVTDFQNLDDVLRDLARSAGVTFTYDEQPLELVNKIREAKPSNPKVLGFEIDRKRAVVGIPAAMLGLAFTMLLRLRQFARMNSVSDEPWLILYPVDLFEKLAASIWAFALIASPIIGFWSISTVGEPVLKIIALTLTVFSFFCLILSIYILLRVNQKNGVHRETLEAATQSE